MTDHAIKSAEDWDADRVVLKHRGLALEIHRGLFINNVFRQAQNNGEVPVVDPTTEEEIVRVAAADETDVEDAVRAAEAAAPAWRAMSPYDRSKLLWKLADLLESNGDQLVALEVVNGGKPRGDAAALDLRTSVATLRYYAGWCDKQTGETVNGMRENLLTFTTQEPIGVVGLIVPWNFPMMIACWKLGPALATGNCVVLKSSEWTPLTASAVAALTREAGFPPGVVNVITGLGATCGAALARHPRVGKVSFTGSTRTGREIMRASADSNLKRVGLELGGKSPCVVFDDCKDLAETARWVHMGLFFNAGQCCCATSRVYVQAGVYDRFLAELQRVADAQVVGDPLEAATTIGPVVSRPHYDAVRRYISIGAAEGARCLPSSRPAHPARGFYVEPTIFVDVRDDMRIAQEEIFGPVLVVSRFDTADEAFRRANASDYGLAAAVFTASVDTSLRAVRELQAGTVWVNCCNLTQPHTPFGGFKMSGNARDLGAEALREFTEVKTVMMNISARI